MIRIHSDIPYFIFRNVCFTFRSPVNLLTVILNKIVRVLKTSNVTQALVLDVSRDFYRVLHTSLLYKFRFYRRYKKVFYLIEPLRSQW